MQMIRFSSIDSTNEYLKKNYEHLDHETICVAKTQTKGRGRYNRLWHDDGSSCLFSVLLKEGLFQDKISLYPLAVAYVLHKVLTQYGLELSIKWPNDIYYQHQKIAGILLESTITRNHVDAIIIGIGINTNTKTFPTEIKDHSTSFFLETKTMINHDDLMIKITNGLKEAIPMIKTDFNQIIHYLNTFNYLNNKYISYIEQEKTYQGIVLNISIDGTLEVLRDQKIYQISSGEVLLLKESSDV
jgi:BirA family transcriptional regulator, biotin operon repressor / biotin---[acetyl-CoA-carboxylase] ligase